MSLLSRTVVSVLKMSNFKGINVTSPPTVVIMLYEIYIMVLPTDKWTLVLAGIPKLLLWIIFSKITASRNEPSLFLSLIQRVSSYYVSVFILCVLSNNFFAWVRGCI